MDNIALYRAKLKEQKQKRIDSPLVRYNEHDQPVCKVCDVVLKSESQWVGHQASRKHHEAINNLKATAAAAKNPNNVKSEPPKDLPKPKPEIFEGVSRKEPEPSAALSKPRASSMLPPNFFYQQETKRPKNAWLIGQNMVISVVSKYCLLYFEAFLRGGAVHAILMN